MQFERLCFLLGAVAGTGNRVRWSYNWPGWVKNIFKIISKGISNHIGFCNKLFVHFNLNKRVILPFTIRKVFPKLITVRFQTVIDRLPISVSVGLNSKV